ncbi:methyltransferase domain-containing protein [Candidatus Pacearchaeota archaeon]|nr:methyltransferase domain-containing protein [Candidatus Pacearchaeota archaeon]
MYKEQLIENLRNQGFPLFIIEAFASVPRELFIPKNLEQYAYEDSPLPIGEKQTISQPYTMAFMLSLLGVEKIRKNKIKILEIGSGSGYVLALLSKLCPQAKIFGVEIIRTLSENSKQILSNYKNIKIINKSGILGLPDSAPYDRILVSASAHNISIIDKITNQLKDKGILVSPVGNSIIQLKKHNNKLEKKEFPGFAFVPLVE